MYLALYEYTLYTCIHDTGPMPVAARIVAAMLGTNLATPQHTWPRGCIDHGKIYGHRTVSVAELHLTLRISIGQMELHDRYGRQMGECVQQGHVVMETSYIG